MQRTLCTRCKKNLAVVFVARVEGGETKNEGYCLKCARELGIGPINDLIRQMGISESDLENMSESLTAIAEESADLFPTAEDSEEGNNTATFPFLDKLFGARPPEGAPAEPAKGQAGQGEEKKEKSKHKFLDAYCTNLNRKAMSGQVDRIVGRSEEISRVIQILNRRQKNNPCLIGEPGVGKTAIAEGLAARIAEGHVPMKLQNKEVWLLDLTSMVAGTQFRGQFESRMKGLIEEVRRLGNIILVIDEVHNIVGAGDSEGSMNAANILKPALSRGEVQVIGATTFAEYRKYIEKDAALERRFQPVTVAEPSIEDTVEILKGIRGYYEQFHSVIIPDRICREAVLLSERYITDRYLPDKAIDLIDEAASAANLANRSLVRAAQLSAEHKSVCAERDALLAAAPEAQDYARIAELKSRELQLCDEMAKNPAETPELTYEDLAHVIELWTKIPASRVCEQEFERLVSLPDRLRARLIGQDAAVEAVSAAIRRSRAGVSPKRKPVSFIFAGPTGVGKTELVRLLAQDLFDAPESLIRLDMSEFMEKHAVSRIIGSPPGYVGYDEAGQLTEKIRRRPYSVVLFDEIEKAHPDVMNILLQILDEGHITDAHGREVSFENTVIVMTTNAGSERSAGSLGFGASAAAADSDRTMKALSEFLRPEFLNRVDEIITFNHLTESDFAAICRIMLGELRDSLAGRDIALTWEDSVVELLVRDSYSVKFGARNLRRRIQKEVEDRIAAAVISAWRDSFSAVHLSVTEGTVRAELS